MERFIICVVYLSSLQLTNSVQPHSQLKNYHHPHLGSTSIRHCTHNQYYDNHEGRCLLVPGGGAVTLIETHKKCEEEISRVDFFNKRRYTICRSSKIIHAECPINQIFSERLKRCIFDDSPGIEDNSKVEEEISSLSNFFTSSLLPSCEKSGVYPSPENCHVYFICTSNGFRLFKEVHSCLHGSVYDPLEKICSDKIPCFSDESSELLLSTTEKPLTTIAEFISSRITSRVDEENSNKKEVIPSVMTTAMTPVDEVLGAKFSGESTPLSSDFTTSSATSIDKVEEEISNVELSAKGMTEERMSTVGIFEDFGTTENSINEVASTEEIPLASEVSTSPEEEIESSTIQSSNPLSDNLIMTTENPMTTEEILMTSEVSISTEEEIEVSTPQSILQSSTEISSQNSTDEVDEEGFTEVTTSESWTSEDQNISSSTSDFESTREAITNEDMISPTSYFETTTETSNTSTIDYESTTEINTSEEIVSSTSSIPEFIDESTSKSSSTSSDFDYPFMTTENSTIVDDEEEITSTSPVISTGEPAISSEKSTSTDEEMKATTSSLESTQSSSTSSDFDHPFMTTENSTIVNDEEEITSTSSVMSTEEPTISSEKSTSNDEEMKSTTAPSLQTTGIPEVSTVSEKSSTEKSVTNEDEGRKEDKSTTGSEVPLSSDEVESSTSKMILNKSTTEFSEIMREDETQPSQGISTTESINHEVATQTSNNLTTIAEEFTSTTEIPESLVTKEVDGTTKIDD